MREERFAEIVSRIFESNGFSRMPQRLPEMKDGEPDLVMTKDAVTYCLEVRMSRRPTCSVDSIVLAARKLVELTKKKNWIPVVVVGSMVDSSQWGELMGLSIRLVVLDIQNLLYMALSDKSLYDVLIAQLPYTAEGLVPQRPDFNGMISWAGIRYAGGYGDADTVAVEELDQRADAMRHDEGDSCFVDEFGMIHLESDPGSDNAIRAEDNVFGSDSKSVITPNDPIWDGPEQPAESDPRCILLGNLETGKSSMLLHYQFEQQKKSNADLRDQIGKWKGGKGTSLSVQYEKLCTRVLMRLFAEDLTLWKEQAKSDAGLFRFDLICKIKRDNHKDFWEVAERYFNSKYIIFEFKNYTQKVTQKEIFTTVRYLYTKALRGIAIIISPNGIDQNADKAIRGVLRDEGKLVLSLTNEELVRMLEMKEYGEDPADYLSDKLDNLLIDLEK